jgi:hypothetical protein
MTTPSRPDRTGGVVLASLPAWGDAVVQRAALLRIFLAALL